MDEREALRIAIERARIRLDEALERAKSMDECYDLSLEVDRLIENYVYFSTPPPAYTICQAHKRS